MKTTIRIIFAPMVGLLFLMFAVAIFYGAWRTPRFVPNEAQLFLLDTVGAAIIAFIAAQLGITVAKEGIQGFRAGMRASMGGKTHSEYLLLADAALFLIGGCFFVLFWAWPQFLAVPVGDPPLAAAPAYIGAQAKAFVGVTLAALASLGTSG